MTVNRFDDFTTAYAKLPTCDLRKASDLRQGETCSKLMLEMYEARNWGAPDPRK